MTQEREKADRKVGKAICLNAKMRIRIARFQVFGRRLRFCVFLKSAGVGLRCVATAGVRRGQIGVLQGDVLSAWAGGAQALAAQGAVVLARETEAGPGGGRARSRVGVTF